MAVVWCAGQVSVVSGGLTDDALRKAFIASNPDVLQQYSSDLLGLAMQVYGSTVLASVRPSQVICTFSLYFECALDVY